MIRRGVRLDALSLTVLCVLGVWFWQARVIAPARQPPTIFDGGDQYMEYYPWHEQAARRLASGDFPLWDSWQLAGVPFLANLQTGVLYPPNLLHLALPTERAMEVLALFHLLLAGVLAYALGRALGLGRIPSMVGGLVYPWTGFLVSMHLFDPYIAVLAWVPAPFIAVARIHRGGGLRWCAVLAGCVAMLIVAGYAGFAVYALKALGLYTIWNGLRTLREQRAVKPVLGEAAWVAAGVILGLCLAAPQWIPTLELSGLSGRTLQGLGEQQIEAYGVRQLAQWKSLFLAGAGGHIGLTAALILLPALLVPRLRAEAAFFLTIALVGAVLALGSATPLFDLYKSLPMGRTFRVPERFLSMFVFGASIAASLGLEAILARLSAKAGGRRGIGAIVLVTCIALFASGLAQPSLLTLASVLVIGGAALLPRIATKAAGFAIIALVFTNLFVTTENRIVQIWQEGATRPLHEFDAMYDKLRAQLGMQRALVRMAPYQLTRIFPKQASLHQIYLFEDYDPLVPRRYADYMSFLQTGRSSKSGPFIYIGMLDMHAPILFPRLLAAAGVAVGVELADQIEGKAVFRFIKIEGALPRAYIVHGVRAAINPSMTLRSIAEGDLDLAGEVILESPPESALKNADHPGSEEFVRIRDYAHEVVHLEARLSRPGAVVLLDADFPGWQAEVNGSPARIYNANYLFRALLLPAGNYQIVYRYVPRSFRMGLAAAAAGLAVLIALIVLSKRKRFRNG